MIYSASITVELTCDNINPTKHIGLYIYLQVTGIDTFNQASTGEHK